jgi:hypothetical protein
MEKIIKVKLTHEHPNWPFLRQTPNLSGIWGNYHFFINQDIQECDYWVVYDGMLKTEETICPSENIILVTAEPPSIKTYGQKFINQFATVVSCKRDIKHPNIIYSQQAQPWFVEKNYDELISISPPQKNKLLSIIASKTLVTKGHRQRYEFALKLKEHFGDIVDVYGRGTNNFEDKWDVLAPYKYSVVIENSRHDDYLTEKIADCFLAETFPFYYGCPNIDKYFDRSSFELIDISNFGESIQKIEEYMLDEQHYSRNHSKILESKNKYLQELSLFPLLGSIIQESEDRLGRQEKKNNEIHPEGSDEKLFSKFKLKGRQMSDWTAQRLNRG